MASPVKVSRGPRRPAVRQACPFVGGMRGVSPETDAAMPKKQTTAGKKARAAARGGEKYTTALRRQFPPGTSPAAAPYGSGTDSAHPVSLEHRSLLDHPPGFRTFRGTELFERIGGQSTIDRLVDLLYEGIGDDDQLRPLFPRDLAGSRSMQKLFFAEWLGGPRRYSEQAHAGLQTQPRRSADYARDRRPVAGALPPGDGGHGRGRERSQRDLCTGPLPRRGSRQRAGGPGKTPGARRQAWREGRSRRRIKDRPTASGLVRHRRP